ncbi:hypothetical protein FOWG_10143 [Fusarium oxysporum f. sp. lycopersici MN25]|nr:hypothetical protein FOWG_10143 [Fusarium oxysporum f. sp. lycopersici MN25]
MCQVGNIGYQPLSRYRCRERTNLVIITSLYKSAVELIISICLLQLLETENVPLESGGVLVVRPHLHKELLRGDIDITQPLRQNPSGPRPDPAVIFRDYHTEHGDIN